MGLLGSLGASPFTRLGLGLRGGLTLGATEGLYVGVIGTYFAGTSVTDRGSNLHLMQSAPAVQ